jgi:hypothetical protein
MTRRFSVPLPLLADAALRLGARPVLLAAWHRSAAGRALLRHRLADAAATAGPIWPGSVPPAPPVGLADPDQVLAAAERVPTGGWHGPFRADLPAAGLDLFGPGDVRPVWERNRWAELPLLAQAARLAPAAGHGVRAAALLADWSAANPAFRGPNWACGQEAALRALHCCLALALLDAAPPPAARALLALHARRIAAAPRYAEAQDNNHPISEAAGLLALGAALGEPSLARRGATRLDRHILRLVAPDGGFAQLSTGYHRLLLDVVAVAEWLARRAGAPGLSEAARTRMAAATDLLWRLTDPATGLTPRLGHQDGSAFADLARVGPADARPSVERAARLFCDRGGGFGPDDGCAWLDLGAEQPGGFIAAPRWQAAGLEGWAASGARAVLRVGPLRFRPGQADLLHFDLWDGATNLLRDGGTGAYNPGPERAWWLAALAGTAGHNTLAFDDAEQMPRLSRFLFARWPACGPLPQGGWLRDSRGNRHQRLVRVQGREWRVEDSIAGPFRALALRWRLAPGLWRLRPDGADSPAASLTVTADAPLDLTLEPGWESPAYGEVVPAPVLVARMAAPVSRLLTIVALP